MLLSCDADRAALRALGALVFCNPFVPRRIELEQEVLGEDFEPTDRVWHRGTGRRADSANLAALSRRAGELVELMRTALAAGRRPTETERSDYQDAVLYLLYDGIRADLADRIAAPGRRDTTTRVYRRFAAETARLTDDVGVPLAHGMTTARLFACFDQVRRAFHHTISAIAGASRPVAQLRARVWQSVFTHDVRRYQRSLHARMGDVTTLICGPSGAGKELVARAIGLARFVPFDEKTRRFAVDPESSFFTLNLSALSPTLIESELFGHRRGAFTGAVADRDGWLAVCPPSGTVFLDEIGEIDEGIQVKLLRVLETRRFQPLGSTEDRAFRGKTVAATNRDLAAEMKDGRFREDLYYRLCADTIVTPSLRERLDDNPEELATLAHVLAVRLVGEGEADSLADEACDWIARNLGDRYPWPGNVRELMHCISNVMIHRDYRPPRPGAADLRSRLAAEFLAAEHSADEMMRRYCTLAYAASGSYVAGGRRIGLDRRTVKEHVDRELLRGL